MLAIRGLLILLIGVPTATLTAASPYREETGRAIKALSAEEMQSLRAGRGMGLAKAAELNGYPGPMHVLELADDLSLTPAQREATQALFGRMQASARQLGEQLIEAERDLDELFRHRTIDQPALSRGLRRIADLQALLRETHLAAHLEQTRLLDDRQRAAYRQLRGYGDHAHDAAHH